jgi:putative flippase GtrA
LIRSLIRRHGEALAAYVLIGGASALAEWSVFWVLLKVASDQYIAAAVLAFIVATFVNYLLCVRTIFVSKTRSSWRDLAMVYVASLLAFTVNVLTLDVLVREFGLDPMISKIAGTGAAFLFNFASRQFVIFGQASKIAVVVVGRHASAIKRNDQNPGRLAALVTVHQYQSDDTGARHKAKKTFCTQVGNFAWSPTTGSKKRLLEFLRAGHGITSSTPKRWAICRYDDAKRQLKSAPRNCAISGRRDSLARICWRRF